jgi:hypothetical protein
MKKRKELLSKVGRRNGGHVISLKLSWHSCMRVS